MDSLWQTIQSLSTMDSLWQTIQSLSTQNKKWLSDKLIQDLHEEKDKRISKEELLAKIDNGLKEIRLYQEGKLELKTLEEALDEIPD